ncbi:S-layer homology domain-containing protein [Pseudalkalibacillus salsuginis]|uniref:S-layer homology domain-containing protein n=1 Tax=Pseudalkalibacillus salsuginis TaxID=2910972 RepID=UPI001F20C856|nr:S-layer homology domain-containing protein [Pseudalkalibacillus salsuginis]MCF6410096.1 S-layer homology domain-containing protein [Pseudalkalibacillus salsuginis]
MAYQPKSYRKFMATSLSAAVVASVAAPVAGSAATSFSDVPSGSYYADAVMYLAAEGHLNGYGDGTFKPLNDISRAEAAKVLMSAKGLKASGTENYSDVNSGHWFYDAVRATSSAGIFEGYEGKFNPEGELTREAAAKIITEAYGLTGGGATPFKDVSGWAKSYIEVAYNNGIIKGKTNTSFDPKANVTRADFAVMIHRAIEATAAPAVTSVSAINATQIEVNFNTELDKTDAETVANYSLSGGAVVTDASLSTDKKTVTLTLSSAEASDEVLVVNPIKTAADATVTTEKYSQVYSYEDLVRPMVSQVTYSDYQNAVIHFSEPMADLGSVTTSNGNVTVGTLSTDGMSAKVSMSAAAEGSYTVTIVGATDKGGNLISPNPVTLTVTKAKTDTVAPAVSGVTTNGTQNLTVQFSEALAAAPTVAVTNTTVSTITQDANDPTKYHITLATAVTGVETVTVNAGYTDPSGNAGVKFSKLVEFSADTTDPAYKSHQVKTIGGVQYLVVTFDEELTTASGTITGTYVDGNSVTHSASLSAVSLHDADGDAKTESIKVDLSAAAAGNYNVTLPAGLTTDLSGNASASKSLSFNLGTFADTTKPVVSSVLTQTTKTNADKFTVNFNVDVTAASALNPANYLVEGQRVFESAIFDGDQRTVTLTLKDGAINVDGLRNFTVSNVTGVNGVTMDSYTAQVNFDENVNPTLTSATLEAANTIELNFSELMASTTVDAPDFEVYINGKKATISSVLPDTTNDVYDITLDSSTVVKSLGDTVTVKVLSTNDITDASTPANALKTTGSVTVTR